jgi:hypothetical protein
VPPFPPPAHGEIGAIEDLTQSSAIALSMLAGVLVAGAAGEALMA